MGVDLIPCEVENEEKAMSILTNDELTVKKVKFNIENKISSKEKKEKENPIMTEKKFFYKNIHENLGHPSKDTMVATARKYGYKVQGNKDCDNCKRAKAKWKSI